MASTTKNRELQWRGDGVAGGGAMESRAAGRWSRGRRGDGVPGGGPAGGLVGGMTGRVVHVGGRFVVSPLSGPVLSTTRADPALFPARTDDHSI